MKEYQLLYCDGTMGAAEQARSKIIECTEEYGRRPPGHRSID